MDVPWGLILTATSLVSALFFSIAGLAGTRWFVSDEYKVDRVLTAYAQTGLWKVCINYVAKNNYGDDPESYCTTWDTLNLHITGRVHGARAALVFAVFTIVASIVCVVVSWFKPKINTCLKIIVACLAFTSAVLVFIGIGLFIMEKGDIEDSFRHNVKQTMSFTLAFAVVGGICVMAAAAGTMLNMLKHKKTDDHEMQQTLGDPVDARVTGEDNHVTADVKDAKVEFKKAPNKDAELVLA